MWAEYLTIFGASYLHIVIAGVGVLFFALLPREEKREILLFAIVFLPLAYLIARFGSLLYYSPQPFVVEHFVPLVPHAADNGFPSDHTLFAAAIAVIVFLKRQGWGLILILLALFVGASRVYAGVHSPIDIVGSFLAVILAASATRILLPLLRRRLPSLSAGAAE